MSDHRGKAALVTLDPELSTLLTEFFATRGLPLQTFSSVDTSLDVIMADEDFYLIVCDNQLKAQDLREKIHKLKTGRPDLSCILLCSEMDPDRAIEAIRLGVSEVLQKPLNLNELRVAVERALKVKLVQQQNVALRKEVHRTQVSSPVGLIGKSLGMRHIFELIERISNVTANVLIQGESGTGKEMIARAIHHTSERKNGSFVAINCSAIPETLLESELFGHAKGAFTGAVQRKRGLIEEANGGSLFLDEIGDMAPSLQAKLLRVIQERKVRSVGDNVERSIDVRIIAATHQDLRQLIERGQFRDDLYYRLSVIPIKIPPLRERKEDIPYLAEFFLKKYNATGDLDIHGFTPQAMQRLLELPWGGNVRELENVIERAAVLCRGNLIDEKDLPPPPEKANPFDGAIRKMTQDVPTLAELEKRYIQHILDRTQGRKDHAARILGINRRTLYRKEREYGFTLEPLSDSHAQMAEMPSEPAQEELFSRTNTQGAKDRSHPFH